MNIIPEEKLELHLKLGRKLALFVKTDFHFESRTFDWIQLEKGNDQYKATYIRSFDEGDELFTDVLQFETANTLDEFENHICIGSKDIIFQWIETEFDTKPDQFHKPEELKTIYLELVKSNKLGSQLDD